MWNGIRGWLVEEKELARRFFGQPAERDIDKVTIRDNKCQELLYM
jgi:hypothetical protein